MLQSLYNHHLMNYETRCFKIKLKPNSLEKVRMWAKTINERKSQALETLRDEGVIIECVFLDQTSEGDFLISIMKAENFEKAREAMEKSVHDIDKFHQQFKKETWEDGKKLITERHDYCQREKMIILRFSARQSSLIFANKNQIG